MCEELEAEGLRWIELRRLRDAKKCDLLELRRARCAEMIETAIILVPEEDGYVALDQLKSVEDAAAHKPRAAEAIVTVCRDDDCPLPRLEPRRRGPIVLRAQEGAADRLDAEKRQIEIDEVLRRHARPCVGLRAANADLLEGGVGLGVRKVEPPDRAVTEQRWPVESLEGDIGEDRNSL